MKFYCHNCSNHREEEYHSSDLCILCREKKTKELKERIKKLES